MSEQAAPPPQASAIGARVPLIDGIEKVSGRAAYTADLGHHDALVGRLYRSPYSHAKIRRVNVDKALALAGVVAIVTGEDCDVPFGVLPDAGKMDYYGEIGVTEAVLRVPSDRRDVVLPVLDDYARAFLG